MAERASLIVFAGLPGTGKSTLATALARELGATYLRIDTIEQAIRAAGVLAGEVGPAGYLVAYEVAKANLRLGRTVVADSVNPLAITRTAWRSIGETAAANVTEIEVICSDPLEHRRRVETRAIDIPGLVAPSWDAVLRRDYERWDRPRIVIDTAGRTVEESLNALRLRLTADCGRQHGHG